MRIAIAYDCLFPWTKGGGERLYRTYAQDWAAAGHEVTYLTRLQWTPADPPAIPGVRVVVLSSDPSLHDEQGRRTLPPAIRFFVGLLSHLLRHRRSYDVIFVSATPSLNVFAVRLGLLGARTRVLVDWLEVWSPAQWVEYSGAVLGRVAALLQRTAVRLTPAAVCYSRLVQRRLQEQGMRGEVTLAPGLVPDGRAGIPSTTSPRPPTVVYAGRHIADKRVECLPAALAVARRHEPTLRARILGEGPCRPAVEAEVRRLGLADVVDLPGFLSQGDLESALRAASCLVLPSAREGYGLVVVEAAALGTPSVVVEGPENAAVELVEPGRNGHVAPSTDPEVLAQAVLACVRGGDALRRSTFDWYQEAMETKTVHATAQVLLACLSPAAAPPQV